MAYPYQISTLIISLIRACVANEILKRGSSVLEGGGGGSPRNCRSGCDVRFVQS